MKPQKIFTIGGATFDIFIRTNDHSIMRYSTPDTRKEYLCLDHGGKVRIEEMLESFGGGATNTAIAFSRMGFDVSFVGKIGAEYGDKVINNLSAEGVDTQFVKQTRRDKTGFSTILNTFQGDRTVLAYPGANRFFSAKDLPLKELETADWIFLNHLTEKDSKIPHEILKILKKNPRIKLAWNPGREQLEAGVKKWKELLKHTEILFVNKEEAARFSRKPFQQAGMKTAFGPEGSGPEREDSRCLVTTPKSFLPAYADDISEIMMEFLSSGVKNVVITDGQNGAQATDGKRFYFCPVVTAKRSDTTGAGDGFASGFTTAIARGESLKTALKYGSLNAYHVINDFGAQAGLLSLNDMQKKIKGLDICVTSTKIS